MNSIGFIGGGRVVRIFLEGWARAKKSPAQVVVADPNGDARVKWPARFPSIEATREGMRASAINGTGIFFRP